MDNNPIKINENLHSLMEETGNENGLINSKVNFKRNFNKMYQFNLIKVLTTIIHCTQILPLKFQRTIINQLRIPNY